MLLKQNFLTPTQWKVKHDSDELKVVHPLQCGFLISRSIQYHFVRLESDIRNSLLLNLFPVSVLFYLAKLHDTICKYEMLQYLATSVIQCK